MTPRTVMRHIEPVSGGFRVRIIRDHKLHMVGRYPTVEEAVTARDAFLVSLDSGPQVECTPNGVEITGVKAEELPDWADAFSRAREEFRRTAARVRRQEAQRLRFDAPVVALFCSADHHLGNSGTDVERIYDEAAIVPDTPHAYAVMLGDVVDSMIPGKLQHLNFNQRQAVKDQYVLAERLIETLAERLVLWVGGNHEGWAQDMTGVDYMRLLVARHAPGCLYDTDDARFTVEVAGGREWTCKARHKWRGRSIYNDSHGIERAQKWDQDFTIGLGGHDHKGATVREFNAGGKQGLAIMCGSYKCHDTFARELGLPASGPSTGVAIVFDAERNHLQAFTDLERAAAWMRHLY